MSATICPTVTADDLEVFRLQMEQTVTYAQRVHIDVSDGVFTPNKLIDIEDIWWPGGVWADLHVMYQKPTEHLPAILAVKPQLVIIHAEADGDFVALADELHKNGIEVGVALLPETPVEAIRPALPVIDHVLIFSGHLGYFGGHADLALLDKAHELRQLKPQLELGWDGGVNDQNAAELASGGIDVLNAGGYLHGKDPASAYAKLVTVIQQDGTEA